MIFALDEDVTADAGRRVNEAKSNASSDDEYNAFSAATNDNFEAKSCAKEHNSIRQTPIRGSRSHQPSLAMSLPVNIAKRVFDMDSFLDDEIEEKEEESEVTDGAESSQGSDTGRLRARTIMSTRENRMYRNMRAYSRSIQPVDDPERLFGERPHRRYRPTDQSAEDGSSDSRFAVSESNRMPMDVRIHGTACSLSTAPVIANDLNVAQTSRAGYNESTSSGSVGRTRIIVPSSYVGRL